MKYREFSDLGWRVSEVGLGCWQIGWCWGDVSDWDAASLLKSAADQGVNFFDTSDTYGDGRSERFLRDLLKSRNEQLFVTTKLGRRIRGTTYERGVKYEPMEEFVDRSLLNLGVEAIDLLQLHCPPVEALQQQDTFSVLDALVDKGKVRHYGVSVYHLTEAVEALKNPRVKSIQFVFNIFRQQPAEWFFKLAREAGVALIARGPVASGLLCGHFSTETVFQENDHRNYNRDGSAFDIGDTFSGVSYEIGLAAVEELRKILPMGVTLPQLALKWILMHDEISVVIPGAVNARQVSENIKATEMLDIYDLMPRIKSIYDHFIRADVQDKWQ